jgi:hypothetical protein
MIAAAVASFRARLSRNLLPILLFGGLFCYWLAK